MFTVSNTFIQSVYKLGVSFRHPMTLSYSIWINQCLNCVSCLFQGRNNSSSWSSDFSMTSRWANLILSWLFLFDIVNNLFPYSLVTDVRILYVRPHMRGNKDFVSELTLLLYNKGVFIVKVVLVLSTVASVNGLCLHRHIHQSVTLLLKQCDSCRNISWICMTRRSYFLDSATIPFIIFLGI